MVAEGYYASRCMHNYNKSIGAEMPIADTVYKILWERMQPKKGFEKVEEVLV
jgi:glycerol-3-phosphate dehydrogenase (NAD(P)+)